ncbi:MAG TPA: hypothetical protein VFH51_04860, partial [Myxococcota bacterium]|nr:hypothetical protein [Myxococcota bacterium]
MIQRMNVLGLIVVGLGAVACEKKAEAPVSGTMPPPAPTATATGGSVAAGEEAKNVFAQRCT